MTALDVTRDAAVAHVTFSAPPMNIVTTDVFVELRDVWKALDKDPAVRVVVFRSGDPDFFLAHVDINMILEAPDDGRMPMQVNPFQRLCADVHFSSTVSIAEIAGRVGGGGSEFCASCDMRFGALGRTVVNQMEVALGILPGGGGTQWIPRLIGHGRALEMILGAEDIDAETAERWGYLNRALPADRLSAFVSEVAGRIAGFPPEAVALAKRSVGNAFTMPILDGLKQESALFAEAIRSPRARAALQGFLAAGGQTRDAELNIVELLRNL
ncbi:enoyl-CoA hydratase/isomerase family protein [Mycolicibacterium porcinum]|uniref:Enoyl-CoA hydratase/isomerase family protein n=1 Tax=Mycolicibacterium porcinum TaxID=39693 RepID=A0AAW5SVQ5_9MYCO|nr:enoyl-CoA hydratase/isomerase family protein [Mycolicibacterium porcinum]MCV7386468.1 enoyl-CoA hydratase/isomerase family protein [Mycolicibacterium porcinum]